MSLNQKIERTANDGVEQPFSELSVVRIPASINLDGIKEKNLKDRLHFIPQHTSSRMGICLYRLCEFRVIGGEEVES